MADIIDIANDNAQTLNDSALKAHKNKQTNEPQRVVGDAIECCDCFEILSKARLAAQPNACRCIDCQTIHERRRANT